MVVSTLQVKLDTDTLLVDPTFGSLVLLSITWPDGWVDGKPPKDDGSATADSSAITVEGALTSFKGIAATAPKRLVLISSRMLFADVLMECVEEGVAAVVLRLAVQHAREDDLPVPRTLRRRRRDAELHRADDAPQTRRDRARQRLARDATKPRETGAETVLGAAREAPRRGRPRRRPRLRRVELLADDAPHRRAERFDARPDQRRGRRRGDPGRRPIERRRARRGARIRRRVRRRVAVLRGRRVRVVGDVGAGKVFHRRGEIPRQGGGGDDERARQGAEEHRGLVRHGARGRRARDRGRGERASDRREEAKRRRGDARS